MTNPCPPRLAFLALAAFALGALACGSKPHGAADAGDAGAAGADAGDAGFPGADAGPDGGSKGDGGRGSIEHLVVVVLENHTFDNLFAGYPGAESKSHFDGPDGGFDAPHAPDRLSRDLCHSHECALTDWAGGTNEGWEQTAGANNNGDHLAWAQYRRADIPGFWGLADSYAIADHFHSSMLGPSFPGHTFLLAGQAGWSLGNPSGVSIDWGCDQLPSTRVGTLDNGTCATKDVFPCFDIPSAPDTLAAGVTWKFYGSSYLGEVWSMFDAVRSIRQGPGWQNVVDYGSFEKDLAAGTLPNVSWLVDEDLDSGHPPLSMCDSVKWTVKRVNELVNSPYWERSAVLVTYDDFGGFFDHVPPPTQYGCDAAHPYGLGFRLPLIIVSPWVKKGVFHGVTEQASVVRLIEELFGGPGAVGSLHARDPAARDDVAGSLLDAFDFDQAPNPAVPAQESCP
jgi:phospholipase C